MSLFPEEDVLIKEIETWRVDFFYYFVMQQHYIDKNLMIVLIWVALTNIWSNVFSNLLNKFL
jgi:hypothetical protein